MNWNWRYFCDSRRMIKKKQPNAEGKKEDRPEPRIERGTSRRYAWVHP